MLLQLRGRGRRLDDRAGRGEIAVQHGDAGLSLPGFSTDPDYLREPETREG
jgi:hypothetical protein